MEEYELPGGLIRIRIAESQGTYLYEIQETKLTESDRVNMERTIGEFRDAAAKGKTQNFRDFLQNIEESGKVDQRLKYFIERYYLGYGIIQPLMADPRIEDISCDGAGRPVYVFLKEYGYIATNISFNSEDSLNYFIRKIAQDGGKQVSASVPVVETSLTDGSRVSASLGRYVTTRGPSFSIRRFREVPISPIDLMKLGSANSAQLAYLWITIDYGSNLMVVGGTASGKTTFLNAILSFVTPDRKIVTIEDTRELNLKHENWISTVTRTNGLNAKDEDQTVQIDMFDLLESALRHRPNYIVVGEVRGEETFTVFQAMLAGRFGMGTFHADDIEMFVHRLEAKPISIPRSLITSLNTVVLLDTMYSEGRLNRFLKSISEIVEVDPGTGELIVNDISSKSAEETDDFNESHLLRLISSREGIPHSQLVKEMKLKRQVLQRMYELGISDFDQVEKFFSIFKTDEAKALEMLGLH